MKRSEPKLREYPEADSYRSGCKVAWKVYRERSDAEAAAEAARWNARVCEGWGYDFGYCTPGSITRLKDGRYEVCIP